METKFNFNSQVCTSKAQSERLLAFGLKKETADMYWTKPFGDWIAIVGESGINEEDNIPAWSLHRLIEMIPKSFEADVTILFGKTREVWLSFYMNYDCNIIYLDDCKEEVKGFYAGNVYDKAIDCIEWLINRGYFPKEYLEER